MSAVDEYRRATQSYDHVLVHLTDAAIVELEAKDREHYECWKKDMAAWKADRDRAEQAEEDHRQAMIAVGELNDELAALKEEVAVLEMMLRLKKDALQVRVNENLLAELAARDEALTIAYRFALQTHWEGLRKHLEPFSLDLRARAEEGGEE